MDGSNRYELTEIDKILGIGMLSDGCGAAELVNVLFIRYKVVVEIIWYPNIRRWCPNVRTTAYVPNEMDGHQIMKDVCSIGIFYNNHKTYNYYKALLIGLRIAKLYITRRLIYREDIEILKLIHDQVQYERITNLLDNCDIPERHTSIEEHVDTVVNKNYITGSIKYQLTKYIKENGWE